MFTMVRDVLSQHASGVVTYSRLAASASRSKKEWANTYSTIIEYLLMVRLINFLVWSSIYFQIQPFQYYILRMLANAVVSNDLSIH